MGKNIAFLALKKLKDENENCFITWVIIDILFMDIARPPEMEKRSMKTFHSVIRKDNTCVICYADYW